MSGLPWNLVFSWQTTAWQAAGGIICQGREVLSPCIHLQLSANTMAITNTNLRIGLEEILVTYISSIMKQYKIYYNNTLGNINNNNNNQY